MESEQYSMEILEDLIIKKKISYILKRDGTKQEIDLVHIKNRLVGLSFGLDMKFININLIIWKVIQGMYEGIPTTKLDNLSAETCAYMNLIHPHYSLLAARIAVNNLHKETNESFAQTIYQLYNYKDKANRPAPLISEQVYKVVQEHAEEIQKVIDYDRDYTYDYFGFKTLERSYLLRLDGKPVERPQHLLMRVSLGIHLNDLKSAFQTYDLMSRKFFTHATPTLYNAGTPFAQMSSCFLLDMSEDSIDGIYETLKRCALISKTAGGIGLSVSKIRASQSYIRGTNGISNGLVPMLRVYNDTARYVDQGGGKRKGSFAIYLEPWHADIFEFLQLRKNNGKEENRARDLFYALWIPDLFMERVRDDKEWTLMCPNECPGLYDQWGEKFNETYLKYVSEGKGRQTIKARQLWQEIVDAQIWTGMPYILYKDACNRKSNQQNLGTIKSSNLCTEIIQYTDPDEVAVCNLASINLQAYVNGRDFNYDELLKITRVITANLNKIIDLNYYPVPQARNSNMKHRPIGIGIQGLADALIRMKISFESPEAIQINQLIFETIYYGACLESAHLAEQFGPYQTFDGSPASKGILQFDMWNHTPTNRYDWQSLKNKIIQTGMRNSLLIAPMPTASTSQILSNNESFEPYTSNLYTRRVLAGEFVCINPHLVKDLIELGLWNNIITNKLIQHNGSVQQIEEIPQNIKDLYKTVWEVSQKAVINLALARSPFIDQSQSLNIHIAEPSMAKMTSMHFYAWEKGLKTGMYYLRSRPAADPIKFTVDVEALLKDGGKIDVPHQSHLKRVQQLVVDENENLDQTDKKIKLNTSAPVKQRKLKTVSIEEYEDDICINCGS